MTANELMRYVSDNTDVVIVALRSSEETAPRKYCLGSSEPFRWHSSRQDSADMKANLSLSLTDTSLTTGNTRD